MRKYIYIFREDVPAEIMIEISNQIKKFLKDKKESKLLTNFLENIIEIKK